jgi:hypothetical protein
MPRAMNQDEICHRKFSKIGVKTCILLPNDNRACFSREIGS